MGYLKGLAIAIKRGFDKVLILSNNQEAVQIVQGSAIKMSNSALVIRINTLLVIIVR